MTELRINSADVSDLSNQMTDFSVAEQSTDGVFDQKETEYQIENWEKYYGYYRKIGILKRVINAKADWTVGKGFEADPDTTMILQGIRGNGADTFNTIIENQEKVAEIGGDSFAEIVRDPETHRTINLKPLDPSTMKIVQNRKGIIIRYEQMSKTKKSIPKKFEPEEIFHLSRNRAADEIHGDSLIEALEPTILMREEARSDYRTVLHRNVFPRMIFHLDTDNETEVQAFKAKMDKAYAKNENLYIPKDVVVPELLAVAPNATLNPIAWIESLNNNFYEESGVPQIIAGGAGGFTEAAVKIAYLAFQQTIEENQLYLEEQIGLQLGLEVNFTFPASLENELLSDNKKDGAENIDASETTAGAGQ